MSKYSLQIERKRLNHVLSFSIRQTISQFSGTFNAEFANVNGAMSKNIYLGDTITFVRDDGDIIFEGVVETRRISTNGVDIKLSVSGRDTISHLAESKAPLINFKNTTDNAIIEKVVGSISNDYILDLGPTNNIVDYSIRPSNTIGQVMDGVAKLNNNFIWKTGKTIKKRAIASSGGPITVFFVENNSRNKNVLNISTNESIVNAKTSIASFSNSSGRSKGSLKAEANVDIYDTSAYQTQITSVNGHTGSNSRFERPTTMAASGKNLGEVQRQLANSVKAAEPKAVINITVKDFQNLDLNDIIGIVWNTVGIENSFVITNLTFSLENNNMETTQMEVQPLGSFPK